MGNIINNTIPYGFQENCDMVITTIKKKYGDTVESTLGCCEKLVTRDDDIIRKIRFIILAVKFYPTFFGYNCRHDIEWIVKDLKELNAIESDALISAQIQALEEYILLEHSVSSNVSARYEPVEKLAEYTDPKNILHEGDYVAKLTEGTASIVDYLGSSDEITIPLSIKGIPVDAIGDYAFCSKKIRQVVIHSAIKGIGKKAFSRNHLTNIVLPEELLSIGDNAFEDNELTEIDIPVSVTYLGRGAFLRNKLVKANVPSGLAWIQEYTFSENRLATIELPESITSIEFGAFLENCLETVKIPDNVTSIDSSVFTNNPLKEIILPANVEIGYSSPGGISSLTAAYNRNNRRAGIYRRQEDNWGFFLDSEKFTDWDINLYKEMEELAIRQEKAIEEIKMSKEGEKLSSLQRYFSSPIPKEIWEVMPKDFMDYIRKEIVDAHRMNYVSYPPMCLTEGIMSEFITVHYGFNSKTYNVRTGVCETVSMGL